MSGEKTRFVLGDRPPSVYDAAIPKKKVRKKVSIFAKNYLLLYCQKFSREENFALSQLFCQTAKFNSCKYQDFLPTAKFHFANF